MRWAQFYATYLVILTTTSYKWICIVCMAPVGRFWRSIKTFEDIFWYTSFSITCLKYKHMNKTHFTKKYNLIILFANILLIRWTNWDHILKNLVFLDFFNRKCLNRPTRGEAGRGPNIRKLFEPFGPCFPYKQYVDYNQRTEIERTS